MRFPLSFSKINIFMLCPFRFEQQYVAKTVKDDDNEFTLYGARVHKDLEVYGNTGDVDDLGLESRKFKPLVDKVVNLPGDKHFEFQLALDNDANPTSWFGADVWLRAIADVLVIHEDTALCVDWKTGKPKNNPLQLSLLAAVIFRHFPQIKKVVSGYVWLHHNSSNKETYIRSEFKPVWSQLMGIFNDVQEAIDLGVFPTRVSYMCKYCPVSKTCPASHGAWTRR